GVAVAWTAPMTAVNNSYFTATQYNLYVRDNLLMTAPKLATTNGAYWIVGNSAHQIIERQPAGATVSTSQSTSSSSWVNLSTTGPAVTVTTGTRALVSFAAKMYHNNDQRGSRVSVQVTGASSIAPSLDRSIEVTRSGAGSSNPNRVGIT